MASTQHCPNHAPRLEPIAHDCPGASHRFFQSSVSALRASRTLLCTTTGAFDPGRGCSSPPGLEPLAIQTNNHQRRVADLGDLFFYPDSRGDPAYVSLSFLENRPNVPRAALRYALGLPHFAPLGRWGSMVDRESPRVVCQNRVGHENSCTRFSGLFPQRIAR